MMAVSKLPDYLQVRWSRTADNLLHDETGTLTLGALVFVLERENRVLLNIQCLGRKQWLWTLIAARTLLAPSAARMLLRQVQCPQQLQLSFSLGQNRCSFCSFQHPFIKCNMCFDCLITGYMRSECSQKSTCEACQVSHPTSLHKSLGNSGTPGQSGINVSVPSITQSQTANNEIQTQAPSVIPITSWCIRSERTELDKIR